MTEREQGFDLDTPQRLRARRSTDGLVAQYIRELVVSGSARGAARPGDERPGDRRA